MEGVRVFKKKIGGIWEEGPPHFFPTRIFRPVPGDWVDAGMSEFPTYKYVGGNSLESIVPWEGDTTSIIELSEWIQNGVPEFVNNLVRINSLWENRGMRLQKMLTSFTSGIMHPKMSMDLLR
jgi:hypothetical protein